MLGCDQQGQNLRHGGGIYHRMGIFFCQNGAAGDIHQYGIAAVGGFSQLNGGFRFGSRVGVVRQFTGVQFRHGDRGEAGFRFCFRFRCVGLGVPENTKPCQKEKECSNGEQLLQPLEAFRLLFLFASGGTFCVAGVAFLLAGYICVLLSHNELLAEEIKYIFFSITDRSGNFTIFLRKKFFPFQEK